MNIQKLAVKYKQKATRGCAARIDIVGGITGFAMTGTKNSTIC
jgi:hypothetical protein